MMGAPNPGTTLKAPLTRYRSMRTKMKEMVEAYIKDEKTQKKIEYGGQESSSRKSAFVEEDKLLIMMMGLKCINNMNSNVSEEAIESQE